LERIHGDWQGAQTTTAIGNSRNVLQSTPSSITGYATITTRHIITHLYATYGNITPADLAHNDTRLKAPFDPSQPIEILFDQIEDAVDLAAAARAEYTQDQIVAYAFKLGSLPLHATVGVNASQPTTEHEKHSNPILHIKSCASPNSPRKALDFLQPSQ
jgi:hypothetical protein